MLASLSYKRLQGCQQPMLPQLLAVTYPATASQHVLGVVLAKLHATNDQLLAHEVGV